ncbi:MAG: hypothetical protein R3B07_07490 [Polyangiaceae bacterium]
MAVVGKPGEPGVPPGFERRVIHHKTIHGEILVPVGQEVSLDADAYGYPRASLQVAGQSVVLQFDSGVGALAVSLQRNPPTVYKLPVVKSKVTPDTVAAWYIDTSGLVRISGFAPGVKCTYEGFAPKDPAALERVYTVCSSLRSPDFGPTREATSSERAHGGMTAIPEGAWAEPEMPNTPGAMLRGGTFIARLYLGRLNVSGADCPTDYAGLERPQAPEVEAHVEKRETPAGPVWIRKATEEYDSMRYPAATLLWAPRDGRCCLATLAPWTTQPSEARLEEAITLCDSYRSR